MRSLAFVKYKRAFCFRKRGIKRETSFKGLGFRVYGLGFEGQKEKNASKAKGVQKRVFRVGRGTNRFERARIRES